MVSLGGTRVLVVENDDLNADLLQLQLEQEGLQVLGSSGSVASARQMIEQSRPQLVFLDFRLAGDEESTPLAVLLAGLGIPFIVATGMDTASLPPAFDAGVKLAKPYTGKELAAALQQAMRQD